MGVLEDCADDPQSGAIWVETWWRHVHTEKCASVSLASWLITSNSQYTAQQGEYHGCPYKTWSAAALRSTLQGMQVPAANVETAVSKASAGHFQLACAAVWEGKHGCACTAGITHPNQYYDESRRVLSDKQEPKHEAT